MDFQLEINAVERELACMDARRIGLAATLKSLMERQRNSAAEDTGDQAEAVRRRYRTIHDSLVAHFRAHGAPARTREVYEEMKADGHPFRALEEKSAINAVRNALHARPDTFARTDDGRWQLR